MGAVSIPLEVADVLARRLWEKLRRESNARCGDSLEGPSVPEANHGSEPRG